MATGCLILLVFSVYKNKVYYRKEYLVSKDYIFLIVYTLSVKTFIIFLD